MWTSLLVTAVLGLAQQEAPPRDAGASATERAPEGIDPVTLLQWREACRLVAEHEEEIWPGYRLGEIPALIMHPNVAEALLRHPRPPAGFARFAGASVLGDEPIFARRGATTFSAGMDTSTKLNGITTLVVTDRRARQEGDEAWNLAVMVHEGFHAWADSQLKLVDANELDLLEWPDLDATVNAHLELEGRALAAALAADPNAREEVEAQAMLLLAERERRRGRMLAKAIGYEDHNEQNEGLASYVEWRAYELWAQHGVSQQLGAELPKLRVPADFNERSRQMMNMLGHSARGTFVINGSGFGPGPVRRRGYFFGAALGKLLDRLAPESSSSSGWKQEVAKGRTLTQLLREALGDPTDDELSERANAFEQDADFAALVAAKEKRTADARSERDRRVRSVLEDKGTLLVIDLSELSPSGPLTPSSWNPFGILKVDDQRRLFSQSPTRFDVAGTRVESTADAAVIVDAERRELYVRTPVAADALTSALSTWRGRYSDAAVTIEAPNAVLAPPDGEGRVRLVLRRKS